MLSTQIPSLSPSNTTIMFNDSSYNGDKADGVIAVAMVTVSIPYINIYIRTFPYVS